MPFSIDKISRQNSTLSNQNELNAIAGSQNAQGHKQNSAAGVSAQESSQSSNKPGKGGGKGKDFGSDSDAGSEEGRKLQKQEQAP